METILNCKLEDLEDYYRLLGCDELSTTDQIVSEFKVRALACHPDKHPANPKAVEEFQKLQEAKEVLTDETKRKKYDFWLRSRITVPFSEWQALSDSVKTSIHWAVRTKKEQMLEQAKDTNAKSTENQARQWPAEVISSDEQLSSSNSGHQIFRWTSDAPSSLLQKFRNYEI
ncbi:dnaJ homolog subfamily C member 12 [Electrophorus electricus]|uniref:J domain-containing protein n=1 Tax=Electrophorus electricus TaxID=8005 RepID=A0A4W4GCN8_ELEEL|nr:dnaJ homolog subfamily C member 12 [Electrophorus electricus]